MELTFLNDADADADGTNPYLTKSMGSFLHAAGTGAAVMTLPSHLVSFTAIDTTAWKSYRRQCADRVENLV